jgi:hypothetical protein
MFGAPQVNFYAGDIEASAGFGGEVTIDLNSCSGWAAGDLA